MKCDLSVVIPVHNEEENIEPLCAELCEVLDGLGREYEVLFVDDGSADGTWQALAAAHQAHPRVKALRFRANAGKAAALSAAFERVQGEIVITIDGDLQDDPAEIPSLLARLDEGYDLVSGWKQRRQDPLGKTLPSKLFNWVTSRACGLSLHDHNCGFKAYRRPVTSELTLYGEQHRYIPALVHWAGFRVAEAPVAHRARTRGKSKYGLERLARGFFDLLTVLFLRRYTTRPLHLFGGLGAIIGLLGVVACAYLSVLWYLHRGPIGNRPLLFLGVLLIIVGVQLVCTGLLAELLIAGLERTRRPHSITEELGT